jgi:glycosyltransferase involved in cell wall biosynthesis
MHVALYHHERLPVRGYGGTERVVVWLARGLLELGHRVTLLAAPGSRLLGAAVVEVEQRALARRGFDLTPWLPAGVDVLHAHTPLRIPPACRHLTTIHGNARPGRRFPANTAFVSADHARRHGSTTFVHNGLDPAECRFEPGKAAPDRAYDIFIGRLHRSKGYHWAIEAAKQRRHNLIVAGGWRPSLSRYVDYVGEIGDSRKAELLAGARCLWMPALWDEPFGLTLIEALASGTPVLGTRRGALPEIVTPEVGALGETLDDLVALRPTLDRIDPAACRALVERRFTHRVMAEGYLALYRTDLTP